MSSIFPIRDKVTLDRGPEPRLVDLDDEMADDVFEALSSGTTRKIFLELHNQPQTASDLAKVTDTSVQNVQYHLEKLSDVDLVEVVDTWYSERGSEMKVYAPQDESLVLFAGRDKQSAFRRLLDRFAGVFAMLLPPSILAGWLANQRDSAVEESIRGEYAMADDDADDTAAPDDSEDAAPAEDDSVVEDVDAEEDEEVGAQTADDDVADDAETPAQEETPVAEDTPVEETEPTPTPEAEEDALDTTASTEFEGETVEVTVNDTSEVAKLAEDDQTVYLVVESTGGSDIMGIDPHVALAFFVGGLVVYGAFMLRNRMV